MLRFCSSRDPPQEVPVPSPHEATTLPSRGLSGLPPKFNLQSSGQRSPQLCTHNISETLPHSGGKLCAEMGFYLLDSCMRVNIQMFLKSHSGLKINNCT